MKSLLYLFLLISSYASPEVGILQIYNFSGREIMPMIGEKALIARAIPHAEETSALMVTAGKHRLETRAGDIKLAEFEFIIRDRETVVLAVIPDVENYVIKKIPVVKEENTLLILSYSNQKHQISVSDRKFILRPNKEYRLEYTREATIRVDGGNSLPFNSEEATSHVLLLWKNQENHIQHAFLPSFTFIVPDGLRPDKTFGRKREKIKGLKTILPN